MSLKSEFEKAVREYQKAQARDYAAEIVLKGVENALPPPQLFSKSCNNENVSFVGRRSYKCHDNFKRIKKNQRTYK